MHTVEKAIQIMCKRFSWQKALIQLDRLNMQGPEHLNATSYLHSLRNLMESNNYVMSFTREAIRARTDAFKTGSDHMNHRESNFVK